MADFEVEAPSRAAMVAAAQAIGAWDAANDRFLPAAPGWALDIYGEKYDAEGAALPGYFGIARWLRASDPPSLPPQLGVIVRPLPIDSPRKWA